MHRQTTAERTGLGRSIRMASLLRRAMIAAVLALIPTSGTAFALPLIEAIIVEQNLSTATVEVFLTTPDDGLIGYSFAVAYTGSLTLDQGNCFSAPGSLGCNAGTQDHPGESPPYYGSIFGLTLPGAGPDFFLPFGVGGERSLVATLTFALNGGGGMVEPGFFNPSGGIADANFDITTNADFAGANLELFTFAGVSIVPEPSTGLMIAAGLLYLGHPRRRARA